MKKLSMLFAFVLCLSGNAVIAAHCAGGHDKAKETSTTTKETKETKDTSEQ
tara:strand:+ start:3774 stop:3926 length:153 start_codon:yes stop_codon:yes gene_type:complete